MSGLVHNHIGGVFLPVSNIEAARTWYCALLELETRKNCFGEPQLFHECWLSSVSG